jgi:hypothetical protein
LFTINKFASNMNLLRQCSKIVAGFCLLQLPIAAHAQSTKDVPAEKFQGTWTVQKHYFRTLTEGADDFDSLGEESSEGKFSARQEIRFRRHTSGAIQQIWTNQDGEVTRSKGIEILEVTPTRLVYRAWSDHPTWKTIITIGEDGSAVYQVRSLKHQETAILNKAGARDPSEHETESEQDGGGQPATRPEAK